jgi:hypothetical protein
LGGEVGVIDTGELLTVAELAVAFAGFSALISVFASRSSVEDSRLESYGLRGLVEVSLMVAAFSVFPLIPHKLALADETVWRISSAAYFLVRVVGVFFAMRRFRRIEHAAGASERTIRNWILWPLSALSFIALVLVASGLLPAASSALYFAVLYIDLVLAGILFAQVASSAFEIPTK